MTYEVGGHDYRISAGARVPSRLAALIVLSTAENEVVLEALNANHTPVLAEASTLLAPPVSPDLVAGPPTSVPPAINPSDWVVRAVHSVLGVNAEGHDALDVVRTAHELLGEKQAGDAAAAKAKAALTILASASPQFAAMLAARFGIPASGDLPAFLAAVTRASGHGWNPLLSGVSTWIDGTSAWSEALQQARQEAGSSIEEARKKLERLAAARGEADAPAAIEELWAWVSGHAEDARDEALGQLTDAGRRLADGLTSLREVVRRSMT